MSRAPLSAAAWRAREMRLIFACSEGNEHSLPFLPLSLFPSSTFCTTWGGRPLSLHMVLFDKFCKLPKRSNLVVHPLYCSTLSTQYVRFLRNIIHILIQKYDLFLPGDCEYSIAQLRTCMEFPYNYLQIIYCKISSL